jgi:hypothetical protein
LIFFFQQKQTDLPKCFLRKSYPLFYFEQNSPKKGRENMKQNFSNYCFNFWFFKWQLTVCGYPKVAISKHFTVNQAQTLIEAQSLI